MAIPSAPLRGRFGFKATCSWGDFGAGPFASQMIAKAKSNLRNPSQFSAPRKGEFTPDRNAGAKMDNRTGALAVMTANVTRK